MSMRLTVLGSGTIIPSAYRKQTSLVLDTGEGILLFECGPSVPGAMAAAGFSPYSPDGVFISHLHPDHSLGLGHLIAAALNDPLFERESRMDIYGPPGIEEYTRRLLTLHPSLEKADSVIDLHEMRYGDSVSCGGSRVETGKAFHGDMDALAYRVSRAGGVFCYTGDTAFDECLVEFVTGADLLAAECSFPDGYPVKGHMTPSEAGTLAGRAGVKRLLLVHMYPVLQAEEAERSAREKFMGHLIVAEDGMNIGV